MDRVREEGSQDKILCSNSRYLKSIKKLRKTPYLKERNEKRFSKKMDKCGQKGKGKGKNPILQPQRIFWKKL